MGHARPRVADPSDVSTGKGPEAAKVSRYFIEANRKEGVGCEIPPVTYRTEPFPLVF